MRVNGSQASSLIALDGGTLAGTGTVGAILAGIGSATIAPGDSLANIFSVLSTGNLTLGAATTYAVKVGLSDTPGSGHDQLNVSGTVSLNNATVTVLPSGNGSFTGPPAGYQAVIIRNDGTDAVSGVFAGRPEGSVVFDGPRVGDEFFISYRGGDGNDVVVYSPGTATWSGGAGGASSNSNWSTPANWVLNRVPLPGERLAFPATGQSVSINDYPAGLILRSIEITGPHTLNGSAVLLGEGLLHTSALNAAVNLPVGGAGITKLGAGLLILNAVNPFTGNVLVAQGTLEIRNAAALGAQFGNTVVAAGATLRVALPAGSGGVPEAVQLNGSGIGGIGALVADGPNSALWSGPITLASDAAIGSLQAADQSFRAVGCDLRQRRTHEGRQRPGGTHRHRTEHVHRPYRRHRRHPGPVGSVVADHQSDYDRRRRR